MPEQLAFNMDCLEAMRQMEDNAFDLAVVDPPYGINITKSDRIFGSSRSVKVEREREREAQSAEAVHLAERKTQIGGCQLSRPKFTTPSTIKRHRMQNIFLS